MYNRYVDGWHLGPDDPALYRENGQRLLKKVTPIPRRLPYLVYGSGPKAWPEPMETLRHGVHIPSEGLPGIRAVRLSSRNRVATDELVDVLLRGPSSLTPESAN